MLWILRCRHMQTYIRIWLNNAIRVICRQLILVVNREFLELFLVVNREYGMFVGSASTLRETFAPYAVPFR